MKFIVPFDQIGQATPGAWQNAAPSSGVQGSIINCDVFPAMQNEILNAITEAGITPSASDFAQLLRAIRSGQLTTFTDTGTTADALVITPTTAHTSLVKGLPFRVFPAFSNVTTKPKLTLGTTGLAAQIVRRDQSAVSVGDILAGVPFDVVFDGAAFRTLSVVPSEIASYVSNSTTISTAIQNFVNASTPRGSTKLSAFTGNKVLDDIASSGYSIAQSTGSIKGASYADMSATCAIRDVASTGSEGSATARIAINNITDGTVSYSNYVGGGAYYQNTQVPLVVPRVIVALDSTKTYSFGLALQKGSSVGQTQAYDAYVFAQHDGNNL